ncbi:CotD family spore coat protein [Falsibacillus albus]|uniref:Spore coat protein CotD n=1 Tax=Falsibacillus albus TaxID=2478915 RepID=A0A3L7JXW9_9BACI|nr:CotD family spore coat protein [Falsibacillus albus]RLQ95145.1 spore coat protein CotD [Falsibacillus albus]
MYCRPPHVLPAIVHPTKCCVNHTYSTVEVPHIHPTHTTTVNHTMFQHKHYFPQTQSAVSDVSNQQFNCGPGAAPTGPMGPQMGGGQPMGPMGPQMGPMGPMGQMGPYGR